MPSAIHRLVPLDNENRWSDLLAVLIENDPSTAAAVLGLGEVMGRNVSVAREVPAAGGADRVDILVHVDGLLEAVLEAKVLSGLGVRQLDRYSASYPDARSYLVLSPGRLVIHPGAALGWRAVSWESVLTYFTRSANPWVAETAAGWLSYLSAALPKVSPTLRWNDIRAGEGFALAMRARMSWAYSSLQVPDPVQADLVQSGGSKAWVARMYAPGAVPGYVVAAEAEEKSARAWPAVATDGASPLKGPEVWVGLRQHDVDTSAGFDWDYLSALWGVMKDARTDWITKTRPGLRAAHDQEGWERIGAPAGLGFGFGDRQATKSGACMFGAKFRLAPEVTLGELVAELQRTADLLRTLAAINPS